MINFSEVSKLIYEKKTKESCTIALELLSNPSLGIEEALRYLYMRDAYFRLGNKDKVIECGQLANKYAEEFFCSKKILDSINLYNQCMVIKSNLENIGMCDIKINAYIRVQNNTFEIALHKDKFYKGVLIIALKQEVEEKINYRSREERYLYYKAIADEISQKIKEIIPKNLYGDIIINTSRCA